MGKNPLDVGVIQAVLASWYENVVQAHKHSLQVRQTMYQSYLTQQAVSRQAFLETLAPGAVSSRGLKVDVDEGLVESLVQYWQREHKIGCGVIRDLYYALCELFLGTIVFEDAETLNVLRDHKGGVIFLANHQTAVESSLFSIVFSALGGRPIVALSKAEHRQSWIGGMLQLVSEYPGADAPTSILYMDRADQASVLKSFQTLTQMIRTKHYSALIHVEGTRARQAGKAIESLSSSLIDMACAEEIALVPVRFSGGLPIEGIESRLDYPVGFGSQDIIVGKPIEPHHLCQLSSSARKQLVLQKLNGIIAHPERPNPPNPDIERMVERWRHSSTIPMEKLVMIAALEQVTSPSPETAALLRLITGLETLSGTTAHEAWLRKTACFFLETSNDGHQVGTQQETALLRERR